jgi:hypothetical protein
MTNWKTTLSAVLGGVVILVNKYWDLGLPPDVVIAVVIGVVALFMKDYDTTGNGKESTKEE